MTATPIRGKSLRGQPRPTTTIERTCRRCGAAFIGSPSDGRGLWSEWKWFCSQECFDGKAAVLPNTPASEDE